MEGNILNFLKKKGESKEMAVAYSNSIEGAHIKLGDSQDCPDTKVVYHSVVLVLPTGHMRVMYFESIKMQQEWLLTLLRLQGFVNQIDQYELDSNPLQRGNLCIVTCAKHRVTGANVVVKTIDKVKLQQSENTYLGQEAAMLTNCKHPQIIKCIEGFESSDKIYIVTRYHSGGDLQMYMENRSFAVLEEDRVRELAVKIAQGLKFLHKKGIVHRDFKLENILMSDNTDTSIPIISDLGHAQRLKEGQTFSRFCGTKMYIAPEIFERQAYSFPVDIWGFGIILYLLVAGRAPFPRIKESLTKKNLTDFVRLIHESELKFEGKSWLLISDDFKDLLSGMLEKDQIKRMTIDDVLHHPWFKE